MATPLHYPNIWRMFAISYSKSWNVNSASKLLTLLLQFSNADMQREHMAIMTEADADDPAGSCYKYYDYSGNLSSVVIISNMCKESCYTVSLAM